MDYECTSEKKNKQKKQQQKNNNILVACGSVLFINKMYKTGQQNWYRCTVIKTPIVDSRDDIIKLSGVYRIKQTSEKMLTLWFAVYDDKHVKPKLKQNPKLYFMILVHR